jgi:hypothetical protein
MLKSSMIGIALILLQGCAVNSAGSETTSAVCRELGKVKPSYSVADSDATKEAGVKFLTVFRAVCDA